LKFKKNLKGFTLIELIIAMCMFGILMLMVISISKPLGSLLSDSKQFTNQRSVAEGISNYICENVRYSSEVIVYQNCKPATSVENNGYDVIRISNNDFDTWTGKNYYGRVRIQRDYTTDGAKPWDTAADAMGKAYYGREYYSFSVTAADTTDTITVTTTTYDRDTFDTATMTGTEITQATAKVSTLNDSSISVPPPGTTTADPGVTYIAYK